MDGLRDAQGEVRALKRVERMCAANDLENDEEVALSLEASAGDPAGLVAALRTVARARGMAAVARKASISREGLYKALAEDGKPGFATIVQVANALGLEITFKQKRSSNAVAARPASAAVAAKGQKTKKPAKAPR